MNKIVIALAFIIMSCSNFGSKADRDPKSLRDLNIEVTYGKSEPSKIVNTEYNFNNLEETDSYQVAIREGEKTSPRFKAIKFLTDYKRSGYKICPDESEDNLFKEGLINPTAKSSIVSSLLQKGEASFFILSAPINVSYLYFFERVEYLDFKIILPWIKHEKADQYISEELQKAGLVCNSCTEDNISLAYLKHTGKEKLPLFLLTRQADEYLQFTSELGSIKIVPDFKKCENIK